MKGAITMNAQYMQELRRELENAGAADERILDIIEMVSNRYEIRRNEVVFTQADKDETVQMLNEYIRSRRGEGLSEKTLKLYGNRVKDFANWCNKPIGKVQKSDIQAYLREYENTHHVIRRTMETYRIALCCFFKWASGEEMIERNPSDGIRKIKYTKRPRKALTSDQMAMMKGCCQNAKELAIIETMYSTGCRIAELASLKL